MEAERSNVKKYDREERTYDFANSTKEFLKKIDKSLHNIGYYKQS